MAFPKHGKRESKVYQVWVDMIRRCNNPNRENYKDYGGRGISVCDEWMTFEGFYRDMGDPPQGMSIERNDVNGNYEPSNCRWATIKEQQLNTTRSRFVVVDGEKLNVSTAAAKYGLSTTILKWRLDQGWPDDVAVKRPLRKMARRSEWRKS
jgi:hypothetical protein